MAESGAATLGSGLDGPPARRKRLVRRRPRLDAHPVRGPALSSVP